VCIDLNGSKFKCHLDEHGAACALNYGSTEGSQACRAMWIVRISYVTDDAIFRMHYEVVTSAIRTYALQALLFATTISTEEVLCYLTMLEEEE